MSFQRTHAGRAILVAALAFAAAGLAPSALEPAPPQQPLLLFAPNNAQSGVADATARAGRRPGVMRTRTVTAQQGEWPEALLLNLFDDTSHTAILDRRETLTGGSAWVGHLPGRPGSTVTLVRVGEWLAGSIIMPGSTYSIRTVRPGVQEISEVDQSLFPQEAEPLAAPPPAGNPAAAAGEVAPAADDPPVIDLLVLYTPAAKTAAGGAEGIAASINLSVSETNTSYINSNIVQRVRLVHTEEVPVRRARGLRHRPGTPHQPRRVESPDDGPRQLGGCLARHLRRRPGRARRSARQPAVLRDLLGHGDCRQRVRTLRLQRGR